jgi:hypothetical protein
MTIGVTIDDAQRHGLVDTVQQACLEGVSIDMANAQGGMERPNPAACSG